jgi:hypothetical protein
MIYVLLITENTIVLIISISYIRKPKFSAGSVSNFVLIEKNSSFFERIKIEQLL